MVHACILRFGCDSNMLISNNLLHAYCYCGSTRDALKLFYKMQERDAVSWNTMISGFVGSGNFEEGISFYREMRRVGLSPTQSSFVSALVSSAEVGNLVICRGIHGDSFKCGFSSDLLVGNALLTSYVKCGDVKDSRKLFDGMHNFDEVSLEILLRGYLQQGALGDAFKLFRYSCLVGVPFSCFSLSSLISLCTDSQLIGHGTHIHGYVVKVGLDSDISIVNSLITFYARSYHLEEATRLFYGSTSRDIVTWNSIIAGYAFNGQGDLGVHLVTRLLSIGTIMNESTFSSFLSCCATVNVLASAKKAHVLILKLRRYTDCTTNNVILTMYCRCRSWSYASKVFKALNERDAISFNLFIALLRDLGQNEEAVELFQQIQSEGFKVDELMYSGLISSCSRLTALEIGQQIHSCIIKTGFEKVSLLGNSLLEMYSQCRRLDNMEQIFNEIDIPDIFTWNTVVMGYARCGLIEQSFQIFAKMIESGVQLNEFSYSAILDICSHIGYPVMGEQIHVWIKKLGLVYDTTVMNSLLTMYASSGMMDKAYKVFEEISSPDSVSWNSMISGYAQNGFAEESLRFYLLMNQIGVETNYMTFASISKSCTMLLDYMLGLQFHGQIIKRGLQSDISVLNSLITMYAKCGYLHHSCTIFRNNVDIRDVITWNSMICGYAYHGCGREALDTFTEMKVSEEKPNEITFIGVLCACSHAGLISEAQDQFSSMYQDHGVVPSEEHYICMVDILCRAGKLEEAKGLIENMPFNPCSLIWRILLSACRMEGNVGLGKEAAEKLMQLEPHDSSSYVLLSNIYALAEKMEEKADIRRKMKGKGVKKDSGYSWIGN
nr:TPA_asm: hypothetical protein HUJ06_013365 [Nelumbo nucifera]